MGRGDDGAGEERTEFVDRDHSAGQSEGSDRSAVTEPSNISGKCLTPWCSEGRVRDEPGQAFYILTRPAAAAFAPRQTSIWSIRKRRSTPSMRASSATTRTAGCVITAATDVTCPSTVCCYERAATKQANKRRFGTRRRCCVEILSGGILATGTGRSFFLRRLVQDGVK